MGLRSDMLRHAYGACVIPLSYNPSLDLASIGGPAELPGLSIDLSSLTTYTSTGRTGIDDAYMASITDNMSGMHIFLIWIVI